METGGTGGGRFGAGFKPHELRSEPARKKTPTPGSPKPGPKVASAEPTKADAAEEIRDVLELTHKQDDGGESLRFKQSELSAALSRADAVVLEGNKLALGAQTFDVPKKLAGKLTMVEPTRSALSAVWSGVSSRRATLVSAAAGSGAAYAVRWLLEATGTKHEVINLTRTTALDALAGAMRPDEPGKPWVKDGPLARCIRNGGVFVAVGLENADSDVLATLKALAKGARSFHHPVSGEPIPVHEDFRLVLVQDSKKRATKDLVDASNTVEIRPYSESDHARLLKEQHALPTELASQLAAFHQSVVKTVASGGFDFGRGFPLVWSLLDKVGARLSSSTGATPSPEKVRDALYGIYGARLKSPEAIERFEQLLQDAGFPPPATPPKVSPSTDPTYVHTPQQDRVLRFAEKALAAGETVLIEGPGQSGVTRLVEELSKRRGQPLVTVLGHANTDPELLMEMPVFDEAGKIQFVPGRIADALINGKLLYVDHLDHMSPERQNAFFQLQRLEKITVIEGGKPVEKPVHKDARIILSTTAGSHVTRFQPEPSDRAQVTEISLAGPAIDDLAKLIPAEIKKDKALSELIEKVARSLHEESPALGVTKLQRFIDFSRATHLLTEVMSPEHAAARAARLVFGAGSGATIVGELEATAEPEEVKGKKKKDERPLFQKLLGIDQAKVDKLLAPTGYRITASMLPHLDALAIAYRLGRPVLAIGPASSGKTVLGSIWAALAEKTNVRVNFSAATEGRDLMGGLGPVNVKGKTVFKHIEGPAMRAADLDAVLNADEWNLSREAQMALKSLIDYRRSAIDAEAGLEKSFAASFLFATQNPSDKKTGRADPPPAVNDCMFHIFVDAKPLEEKVDIVSSHSGLDRPSIQNIAKFYEDFEVLVAKNKFRSAVGPLTATERDMLKAAKTAEYLAKRDGVKDPEERRRLIGRELFRLAADALLDPTERATVLDLVRKHLGEDIQPPARPTGVKKVKIGGVEMLEIGAARVPVRALGKDKELDKLIPTADGVRPPVGTQLEFLESTMLALELGQPLAIVGATGTGKTMLMRYLAHQLNLPVREQPFHADMTEEHLFGSMVITGEGKVEFQYSPLAQAIKEGCLYIGDEFLTLRNDTREKLNPLTEGSEIQISQKKPPETIRKKDWHPDFRFVITTNGDDIREDGFSTAEASRMRLLGLRDLHELGDYEAIALRDYAEKQIEYTPRAKAQKDEVTAELLKLAGKGAFKKTLEAALGEAGAPEGLDVPSLERPKTDKIGDSELKTFADALQLLHTKKDQPALELVRHWLGGLEPAQLARLASLTLDKEVLGDALRLSAEKGAVREGVLQDPNEALKAADLFTRLRELQQTSKVAGISPLTPRLFASFMDLYVQLRERIGAPDAAMRAASLALWSKIGKPLEKKAIELLTEVFGQASKPAEEFPAPALTEGGAWFGDTFVDAGPVPPWKPSNDRFALTPARCKNLGLVADAMAMGKGRPISCTDDENGETVEVLREYGRLTGRPVTVVSLPPNADIEGMIERLTLTNKEGAASGARSAGGAGAEPVGRIHSGPAPVGGGFEPELQAIGQAVRDGHVLVLRGAGNVRTEVLERLNSLGDGRQGIKLPRSGRWLKADDGFRVVFMRKPDSLYRYSPALENRLIEPLLTTRESDKTQSALENRAAELAAVIKKRTGISEDSALKLSIFHTYLNQVLRDGGFASGHGVGSLLNRDAEAVARRLEWLKSRGVVEDEAEMLHHLILSVYGERFGPSADRELLSMLAGKALGAEGGKVELSSELSPSPHLMRLGEWAVQRDPRGLREGVPGPDSMLPLTDTLSDVEQKIFAALQFGETIHLHGDELVGTASINAVSRLTTSPVLEVEGNEELSEAYLFGGLIQNQETGKFEKHEGLVWQAQATGSTLVVKNASRIPNEVLTKLIEIAATGQVQRVVDGKIEVSPKAFRLVFQTADGDPPLLQELASLSTRVRCPEITDREDLRILVGHILRTVPGGKEMAAGLEHLFHGAGELLAGEAQTDRQSIRFDSARLFAAARQIASAYAEGDRSLEEIVADVLSRMVLRPVGGLSIEGDVQPLVDAFGKSLDKVLTAESVEPIDFVEKPELAALEHDYRDAAPALTSEVLSTSAAVLRSALDGKLGSPATAFKSVAKLIETLASSDVMPEVLAVRSSKTAAAISAKKSIEDDEVKEALADLAGAFEAAAGAEGTFYDVALGFMRGARLWDIEHRLGILERYEQVLGAVGEAGGETGKTRLSDLGKVRERFDAAGALAKVATMRKTVGKALDGYRTRKGEKDEQLEALFRKLIERWDLVATSPIFRDHHQLRNELVDLDKLLEQIKETHATHGSPSAEAVALFEALGVAGETLEGIRIAEQSAELHKDLVRAKQGTENLVKSLRDEVVEIRKLEEAEKANNRLEKNAAQIAGLLSSDLFLHLNLSGEAVSRPEGRSDGELRAKARSEAAELIAPEVQKKRLSMEAHVRDQMAAMKVPSAATFFDDYDVDDADVGSSSDPVEMKDSAIDKLWSSGLAEVAAFEAKRLLEATDQIYSAAKKADAERVDKLYKERAASRAQEIAARVNKSANDLGWELQSIAYNLDLSVTAPALWKEVNEVKADLNLAAKEARGWADAFSDWMKAAGKMMLTIATFGLWGGGSDHAERPAEPDLGAAKKRAHALLEKLAAEVESRAEALPDFKKVGLHKGARDVLVEQLLSADTLGDLASRYAKLAALHGDEHNEEVRKYLSGLLGELADDADRRQVLLRIAAFSESADLLSSKLAMESGVAIDLAPVLESVMKAAEAMRAQPLTDASNKSAIKALKVAIQKIDALGLGDALSPILAAVKGEMEDLVDRLTKLAASAEGGALSLRTAAAAEMLGHLAKAGEQDPGPAAADVLKATIDAGAELSQSSSADLDPRAARAEGLGRWLEKSAGPSDTKTERTVIVRETELKTIQIDFERAQSIVPAEKSEPDAEAAEKVPEEILKARSRVATAAGALGDRVSASLGTFDADKSLALGRLKDLDKATRGAKLLRWSEDLAAAKDLLESVMASDKVGFRGVQTQVAKALDKVRGAARALRTMDDAPAELVASLEGTVEGARSLAAAFSSDRFRQLAVSWASDAMLSVTKATSKLSELVTELDGKDKSKKSIDKMLSDLAEVAGRVGEGKERIGAWSRFSLLAHLHQRLLAMKDGLPSDTHRTAAAELLASIEKAEGPLHLLSGGARGEQTTADLYDSYLDLGAVLGTWKKLTQDIADSYETLGVTLWKLLGPEVEGAPVLDDCQAALDLLEAFKKDATSEKVGARAKEIGLSIGELRNNLLSRTLDTIEDGWRETSSTSLAAVRDARINLVEAKKAFLDYDPLKDKTPLTELGASLLTAIVSASQNMKGPAAVLLAEEVLSLESALSTRAASPGALGLEAKALLEKLAPVMKGATVLAESTDAPERLTKLIEALTKRFGQIRKGNVDRKSVDWAAGATKAMTALLAADHAAMPKKLAEVEAAYFPELVPKPKATLAAASAVELVESRVSSAFQKDAAGTRLGLLSRERDGALHDRPPAEMTGRLEEGTTPGIGKPSFGEPPKLSDKLDVKRKDLPKGRITERSDTLNVVELSAEGLKGIRKTLDKAIAEARAADLAEGPKKKLNPFEAFAEQHADMVDKMAQTLRQFPNTEISFIIDQSGSTLDKYGDSRIIDQEQAALAIGMSAVMRGESNCSVIGFGGIATGNTTPVYKQSDFDFCIFVHKPMAERLDGDTANVVYGLAGNSGGGTDFIGPMNVALGQFSSKANNKLIFFLTDALISNPEDVKNYIDKLRSEGVGVCMMGFGKAQNVDAVAGEFGMHVKSFGEAVQGAAGLLSKTVIANDGKFKGKVTASAQGIGVTDNQLPILSADSAGPMESSLNLKDPVPAMSDPDQVLGSTGKRRTLHNLVDRAKYARALLDLEKHQEGVRGLPSYKRCLKEVRELRNRHDREDIVESLRAAIVQALPRSEGSEWERKQLSGSLFDEEQLPMYVVGLEQGVPVLRLFKRKRPKEKTKARVVLKIDESTSMGDSDKMRANLEALIATGDALKAMDPEIQIAVVGFSDRVRLHQGFEQEWSEESKAHLLHQVSGTHDATDDERGAAEAVGLLEMMSSDVGLVLSFSDGQGMPGTPAVMEAAASSGYGFLTVGVSPECKGVMRFGDQGLYARNLAQLAQKLPAALVKVWEKAGRLVQ